MVPEFANAVLHIAAAGKFLDSKGMAPATSGNYSMRLPGGGMAITVSGTHKGCLGEADIMMADENGKPLEDKKPSAETALHAQIYRLRPQANAILHVHSVPGTALTRLDKSDEIAFAGYEMLKAFPGVDTHETRIAIPVFENSQDMGILSAAIEKRLREDAPAYIIRNHGFYVWGQDMTEAKRVAEALEYLLTCEMETMKIRAGAKA